MTGTPAPTICPKCGSALLWNGRAMTCVGCSYYSLDVKSDRKIPAARSKKKDKRPDNR